MDCPQFLAEPVDLDEFPPLPAAYYNNPSRQRTFLCFILSLKMIDNAALCR